MSLEGHQDGERIERCQVLVLSFRYSENDRVSVSVTLYYAVYVLCMNTCMLLQSCMQANSKTRERGKLGKRERERENHI